MSSAVDRDQGGQRDPVLAVAAVIGELPAVSAAADQQPAVTGHGRPDADPGPVVPALPLGACSGGQPLPGTGRQVAGQPIGADRMPGSGGHPVVAAHRQHVGDLLAFQPFPQRTVIPVCLVGGRPGERHARGGGVAILKYRLYDIDRIISRTLAYAIVTGLLVGVYAGSVLLATQVLKFHSTVAVAASTLVAAALFNPVRRRVQHAVDRRFNRARYNAEQMVTAFAARLQDAVDPDAVRADLTGVVHTALEPTHVSVWLWTAERH